MTRIFAVRTLHAGGIFEELSTESAAHNVVKLLLDELVTVLLDHFFLALTNSSLSTETCIKGLLVPGMFD